MSPRESKTSKLQALAERAIQGTLVELMLRCGTTSCGCHQDPARRHGPHLYLKFRDQNGKSTSLYIPRDKQREMRAAVEAWSRLWQTMVRFSHRNRHAFKQRLRRRQRG
jgi:hypothetical protein